MIKLSDTFLNEIPNSMVDDIVFWPGDKKFALIREFAIDNATSISHEKFRQWSVLTARSALALSLLLYLKGDQ